jgi:hypothetical protein
LKTLSKALFASVACAGFLAGCATSGQGLLVVDPRVNAAPMAAPAVVVEEAYQPMPTDVYIANVAERDVFVSGGNTYFWVVGHDGVRHRHFYAHGDHRADVFHRREELHRVMANHAGHLPDHAIAAHPPMAGFGAHGGPEMRGGIEAHGGAEMHGGPGAHGGPEAHGGPAPAMEAHGQPRPGPMMPVAHAAPPARPAPAAKPSKPEKKS